MMWRPQFEMIVPLSREDCFNRLQKGLDFSLIKGFRFGRSRRSYFVVDKQQVAFDKLNINRMRFDLWSRGGARITIITELHYVNQTTTYIHGELISFAYSMQIILITMMSLMLFGVSLVLLTTGVWAKGLLSLFVGLIFTASVYKRSRYFTNPSRENVFKQIIEYSL